MELRVIKYFLAVAREENITKAAETLHLTQPTLSRQLRELEEELGAELFIRGKRRTTLTEAGILFKVRAEELVSLEERTIHEFSHLSKAVAGDVYLGCGETEAMREVVNGLSPLLREYRDIHLHLLSGNGEQSLDYLEKGSSILPSSAGTCRRRGTTISVCPIGTPGGCSSGRITLWPANRASGWRM